MRQTNRRRYDMLIRLRGFAASHAQLIPTTSPAHEAFSVIATEVERLGTLGVAEHSATPGGRTLETMRTRRELVRILSRARAVARVLARNAPGNPESTPTATNLAKLDDRQLLTAAEEFHASAEPSAAPFA